MINQTRVIATEQSDVYGVSSKGVMMIGFEVVGHGPQKIVVLHGWFGDHTVWQPTYPFIDEEQFAYAFLDYRGYGRSRSMDGSYSLKQISADAIAVVDELGWNAFSIVGHSIGGQAAQRLAVDAPSRVRAVIGVTPAPPTGMQFPPEVEALFNAAADSDESGLQIVNASLGNRLTAEFARHLMRVTRATSEIAAFRGYGRAFIEASFAEEAKSIMAPLLILVGEHDGGITPEFARGIYSSLYPQVEIEILPNSGHYPMLETPAWLITRIEQFIRDRSGK